MVIVWDEPKRLSNLGKHGLDFAALTDDFCLDALVLPVRNDRFAALGRLDDGTIAVIFATLGTEAISVISMRLASRRERMLIDG